MPLSAPEQGLEYLNLERFSSTPLVSDPFDFVIVPGFLAADRFASVANDFPKIDKGGSFPLQALKPGPAFSALIEELVSPAMTAAISEKFDIDLTGRPTMVTLRGQSRDKDGRAHTDSRSKLITALIYLNDQWEADGGRLRMLRRPDDLEDYVAEVPPTQGTLACFRCSENAWHGHKPFVGPRRSIQINWVRDQGVLEREVKRHGLSAWVKSLFGG